MIGNAESTSHHCPHCKKTLFFFSLKPPFSDVYRCERCSLEFILTTRAIAEAWMCVLAVWGWVVGTGVMAISFLFRGEFFAALLLSPMLGLGCAFLMILPGIPIGRHAAVQIKANAPADRTLKKVKLRRHAGWLDGLLIMFRSGDNGSSSKSEAASDEPAPNRHASDPESDGDVDVESIEPSRVYVHQRCGTETIVSGDDFERMANPFTIVSKTFCSGCQTDVSLDEVHWAGQTETISETRAFHRASAPSKAKLIGLLGAPLLGGVLGWFGSRLLLFDDRPWNLVFAVFGAFCAAAFLTPYISKAVGVDYTKKL